MAWMGVAAGEVVAAKTEALASAAEVAAEAAEGIGRGVGVVISPRRRAGRSRRRPRRGSRSRRSRPQHRVASLAA